MSRYMFCTQAASDNERLDMNCIKLSEPRGCDLEIDNGTPQLICRTTANMAAYRRPERRKHGRLHDKYKGGLAFALDLDITCNPSEQENSKTREKLKAYEIPVYPADNRLDARAEEQSRGDAAVEDLKRISCGTEQHVQL